MTAHNHGDFSLMPKTQPRRSPLKRRKITLPPFNHKLLPRADLVEQLSDCLTHKLTVVAAPAGSGKTELIQLWRNQHPETWLVWYNLDSSDNRLSELSRYLSQAIIDTTNTQQLSPSISGGNLEPLSEYFHDQQPRLLICLDNFHELSNADVLDALEICITDPFSQVHWLLLSQQKPSVHFTELRLKDELAELGSVDLNFSVKDIAQLSKNRGQSGDNANAIFDNTQGWIAGVNLSLATAPSGVSNTPASQTTPHSQKAINLFQHLALGQLPENVFSLIQAADVCNPINADLADYIGIKSDSQSAIDYLVDNCLFIQPLDQQENWFHIHPLFFVALKKELKISDEQTLKQRHLRAGEWLIHHQIYEQGLEQLLLSKDSKTFDYHLTNISEEWLLNGNLDAPNRWCAQVDSDRLFGNPKLLLQYLLSLTLSFHVSEATQLLKTYDKLHSEVDNTLAVARQLIKAFTLEEPNKPEDHSRSRQHLLLKSEKTALENFALGTITNLASLSAYLTLNLSESKALANEAKRYHRLANSIHGESYSEYIQSAAQFSMGPNTLELAEHLESFAASKHLQQSQPCYLLMCVATAPIYYELNQHQQAHKYVDIIGKEISTEAHLEVAIFYHLTYAKLLYRNKQGDQADNILSGMLNHASAPHSPRAITMVTFERLRQAMIDKDSQRATLLRDHFFQLQSIQTKKHTPSEQQNCPNTDELHNWGLTWLIDAIHHLVNNRCVEAKQILTFISETLSLSESRYLNAIVTALEISIDWQNNQQQKALTRLCQFIESINHQGYYCLPRDYIANLDEMIIQLGTSMPRFLNPDFCADLTLNTVTHANNKTSSNRVTSRPLLEPLTKRELMLLIDISNGLSNQEISDKRFVAISTVKWHLKNIYAKLDAKHRAQAIARARDLNIIQ